MKITFSRIIIFGENIEGLKNFYMSNFKFKLTEEIKGEWVVLTEGKTEIAFHRIGAAYRDLDDEPFIANNNCKFVFEIDNDIYIENFRNTLIQNGVEMRELKSFENSSYIFCDGIDIEGNVFQISQKKNHVKK